MDDMLPVAPAAPAGVAGQIQVFLAQNRLALIGVSREKRSYSRGILTALVRHGYEVVPVNPAMREVDGLICLERVSDSVPPVQGAFILVGSGMLEELLEECLALGIPRVWIPMPRKGAGLAAVDRCRAAGMTVIYGFCPLMFLPRAGFLHRFHGFLEKRSRAYRN